MREWSTIARVMMCWRRRGTGGASVAGSVGAPPDATGSSGSEAPDEAEVEGASVVEPFPAGGASSGTGGASGSGSAGPGLATAYAVIARWFEVLLEDDLAMGAGLKRRKGGRERWWKAKKASECSQHYLT